MSIENRSDYSSENREKEEAIVAKLSEIKNWASEETERWRAMQNGLKDLRQEILETEKIDIQNSFIFHTCIGSSAPEYVTDFDLSNGRIERLMEELRANPDLQ